MFGATETSMTIRRSRLRCALFAAAAFLPACAAQAQQEDEQAWFQLNTNVPLAPKLRVTLEQIARFSDRQGGLYQTEIGGILGYKIADNVEIGFGYRHVGTHNRNSARDEERVRQHIVATFGRVFTRLRIDERFNPGGNEIGFRIRPLIRYNQPLGKGWALFASHESFYLPNKTSWGQKRGYERMRNILGATVPLSKKVSADIGYLNQWRPGRAGARDQMDHAVTVQMTINLTGFHHPHADD